VQKAGTVAWQPIQAVPGEPEPVLQAKTTVSSGLPLNNTISFGFTHFLFLSSLPLP